MPRTVNDAKLDTPAARLRLKSGRKAYWKTLVPGKLHIGYRRKESKSKEVPGAWLVRRYIGGERYRVAPLGLADDFKSAGGMSYEEAQRLAHERQRSNLRSKLPTTVREALRSYTARLKQEGKPSAADAERRAEQVIAPQLGDILLSELTTADLTRWRKELVEKPARLRTRKGAPQNYRSVPITADQKRARRATVNRTWSILRAALSMAFNDEAVDDDRAWRRVKPFANVTAARPGYLNVEASQRLINAADSASGFRDLVHAALLTGCRYSELARLHVRDLHRGKLHIATSKSGKPRDVVLTGEAAEFFEALAIGRAPDDILLRRWGEDGETGWAKSDQRRPMLEACKAAKIVPAVGFHALRHTWASLSVMSGMPLPVVARNLGHSTTMMVEKHYGHLADSYIDAAIRDHAPTFGMVSKTNVLPLRREPAAQEVIPAEDPEKPRKIRSSQGKRANRFPAKAKSG